MAPVNRARDVSQLAACCVLCCASHTLTFHHLIPRSQHKNKWFRKQFTPDDMRNRGVTLCRRCHSFIHQQFSEKQLGWDLNTLEALMAEGVVKNHIVWAKKQAR